MTDAEKIKKIKDRLREIIDHNLDQLDEIRKSSGTNNVGYSMYLGGHDDLKLILDEIESDEIYDRS